MRKIALAIIFSLAALFSSAQPRIAIINLMDTSLFHVNIGITVFNNSIEEFECQFNSKDYVNQVLESFLSGKLALEFLTIPASQSGKQGKKMNYKSWVEDHQALYKYVIFVENRPWVDPLFNKQLNSNGLRTGVSAISSWAEVYSTIYFTAYRTSNLKTLSYDKSAWFYTRTMKDYEFLEEKTKINPGMLPLIKSKLAGLMDSRIEHFLVSSGLLSQLEYNNIILQRRNQEH
jgi:hypothetical protein